MTSAQSAVTDRTESQVSTTSTLMARTKSPVIPTVKPKIDPQSLILPETYDLPVAAKTPENHVRFEKLSALIKGHLTRRLLKTGKVQGIINSMKDTMNIALQLHRETKDYPSLEDVQLVMFNFWSISCSFCTLGGASKFFVVKQSSLCSHFAKHLISTDF